LKLNRLLILFIVILLTACGGTPASTDKQPEQKVEEAKDLILATTTSTQDSGLLDVLIPMFEEKSGINVKTIAVGTGQALEMGTKGEADVLLVHAPDAEQVIVDSGDAVNRKRVMYNDFIIIGPKVDPANVKGLPVKEAFQSLFDQQGPFISRGDDSGTHKKELGIWKSLSIDPSSLQTYVETGQGMGSTLQVAAEKQGYVLTDRATFLAQQKNLAELEIMVEGDEDLLNIYHVMQVNPEKHTNINGEGANTFVQFMIADDIQKVIKDYGKEEYGQPLFFPYSE
jgi:tungstate transport system substrate-binding protein